MPTSEDTKKTSSEERVVTIDLQPFLIPLSIIIASGIIGLSLYFGMQNSGTTSADGTTTATTQPTTPTPTAAEQPSAAAPEDTSATTTIAENPILGDPSQATIAIVEYSDYECPFCKRHFEQTYPNLKRDYIDTGKAILVFRDFPLYFHDPLATQQAEAAHCVHDQGGDEAYFAFHDQIFETTSSGGNGMQADQLYSLAEAVGADRDEFANCFENNQFADKVQASIQAGQAAGISGTPGFVVGRIQDDGNTIVGERISGAYPFEYFQEVLESYL